MANEIPGVTDGTKDDEPYSLEDVAAIEAARGKPYARLRRTVETLNTVKAQAIAKHTASSTSRCWLQGCTCDFCTIAAERDEALAQYEKLRTEAKEILDTLKGGGPATETLFMLAQRGTARKLEALLK